ncbi:MAG: hypothetical protein BWY47_02129 [Bacteroidetes bacterium ADurb.Bin302]|nr:MAG: hypothetical protein BWY47_02129 [Bacteroidetes bacterium ADurb.Bin302]
MPLNEISLAISPYVARTGKAIQFYMNNKDKTLDQGLMLCIAEGPTEGWPLVGGTETAPIPSLSTKQLTLPIGFKRFKSMDFVISNTEGDLSVGGLNWTKLTAGTDAELYASAITNNSRWIYIEAELETSELAGETYRQVGLFSNLKIDTTVAPDYATRQLFLPSEIIRTGTSPNYSYDGILEVYQNKYPVTRPVELKEIFTWVLEF